MSDQKQITSSELGKKLVGLLDGLLEVGDWTASLFLRTSAKRLRDLRDEANKIAIQDTAQTLVVNTVETKKTIPQGYIQVYISLYQVDGANLQTWYRTIKGLLELSASRPVYKDESHVRELIRSKTDLERNGYVIVNINPADIYGAEKPVSDPFGHELINIKEGAIKLENIVCFIHGNKKRYDLIKDGLVFLGNIV